MKARQRLRFSDLWSGMTGARRTLVQTIVLSIVMQAFILAELDRIGLGHNTFSQAALDLIVRSAEGVLRKTRNLCLSCMLDAVRSGEKTIDIDNVNRVLIQPHWRKECDITEF